jgi:hypothetical protein
MGIRNEFRSNGFVKYQMISIKYYGLIKCDFYGEDLNHKRTLKLN